VRVATVFELGHRFSSLSRCNPDHRLKTDGFIVSSGTRAILGALLAIGGWALRFS